MVDFLLLLYNFLVEYIIFVRIEKNSKNLNLDNFCSIIQISTFNNLQRWQKKNNS